MSGKGDHRRPSQIPEAEVAKAWDRIFGRTKPEPREPDES